MATTLHGVSGLASTTLRARLRHTLKWRLRYSFDRFLAWRENRRREARVIRELSQFDERDLRDLAISRYDFAAIARGTFRR